MTNKAKKYWIGLVCAIVSMFLWIFVAVGLTGGREVEEFTETDKIIMTVFMSPRTRNDTSGCRKLQRLFYKRLSSAAQL